MAAPVRRTATAALRLQPTTFRRTYAGPSSAAAPADPSSAKQPPDQAKTDILRKGAKRDPELYTLLAIMCGAFTLAGWHFSRNPTSSSSENKVSMAPGSEPWNTGSSGKYQYHPGGDPSKPRKDAPSALNEVIIPNVNLPRELHEKYNKWGKEGY